MALTKRPGVRCPYCRCLVNRLALYPTTGVLGKLCFHCLVGRSPNRTYACLKERAK